MSTMVGAELRTTHLAHRLSLAFEPHPAAAADARRAVSATLRGLPVPPELTEDILLVTSELVGNVGEHAAGPARLELSCSTALIVVRVHDHDSNLPVLRPADPLATRGRGLQLVSALASRWGYVEQVGGKYVWAEFELV